MPTTLASDLDHHPTEARVRARGPLGLLTRSSPLQYPVASEIQRGDNPGADAQGPGGHR